MRYAGGLIVALLVVGVTSCGGSASGPSLNTAGVEHTIEAFLANNIGGLPTVVCPGAPMRLGYRFDCEASDGSTIHVTETDGQGHYDYAVDSPATPAGSSSVTASPGPMASASAAQDGAGTGGLRSYLAENFSTATWYADITGIATVAGAAWVDTDLYPDSDATQPARQICAAVSGYVFFDHPGEFSGLSVRSSTGSRLALRTSTGDPC